MSKLISRRKSRVHFKIRQRDLGNVNGYIEETISGSEIIMLFRQEQTISSKFHYIKFWMNQLQVWIHEQKCIFKKGN